jgi:hypothetical protein
MLNREELVPLLLERRLLEPRDVVCGRLAVVDASRRNRNFKVVREDGSGYVIKQGLGAERRRTIAHEADVYGLLESCPPAPALRAALSRCYGFDAAAALLILELHADAQSLLDWYDARTRFPRALAAALGEALGALHGATAASNWTGDGEIQPFVPLPFRLRCPDIPVFSILSGASIELVRVIQGSAELMNGLDAAARDWRVEALVHADARWDNWIVLPRAEPREPRVKLVDWELAGLGDPAWDVGAVFADYLRCWISSAPCLESPEEALYRARRPISAMQPSLRSFWRAYVASRGLDSAAANNVLRWSTRCAGVRLVQLALELLQSANRLTGTAVYLVQLAANVLQHPDEAAARLLGMPELLWS